MAHMPLFAALILGLVFDLVHASPVKMQLLVGGIPANGSSCDASCKWRGRGVGSQKPVLTPVAAFAGRRTGRERRFVLQGTRWRGKHVSYHVSQYPEDLPRAEVDAALHSAFQLWASATSLRFTAVSSPPSPSPSVSPAGAGAAAGPHLDVRWERGAHGDWDAFDGRGGVLAHAAYPSHGGALHFDADERWATNDADAARDRPSLVHIAAHEIGHALGLAHSRAPGAVMAPFYGRARALAPLRRLPADDEAGAAALYGPRALPPAAAPAPVPSHPPHAPHAPQGPCGGQEAWLDAALTAPDGFLYLLQGTGRCSAPVATRARDAAGSATSGPSRTPRPQRHVAGAAALRGRRLHSALGQDILLQGFPLLAVQRRWTSSGRGLPPFATSGIPRGSGVAGRSAPVAR